MLTKDDLEVKLPDDLRDRLGMFKVSHDSIKKPAPWLFEVMQNFIIVRAESLYAHDCIQYSAMSMLFEPRVEGAVVPEYEIIINKAEDGKFNISAKMISDNSKKFRLLRKINQ